MQRLSPFTLIVTFVCLALVGLALVPMLPVKLNPSRTDGGDEQTGIHVGPYQRGKGHVFYFR